MTSSSRPARRVDECVLQGIGLDVDRGGETGGGQARRNRWCDRRWCGIEIATGRFGLPRDLANARRDVPLKNMCSSTWEMPTQRSGSSKNPALTWVTTAATRAERSRLHQQGQPVGEYLAADALRPGGR